MSMSLKTQEVRIEPGVRSKHSLSGGVASISGLLVGYPLDTLKVKLQTDSKFYYNGPLDCCSKVLKEEGIRGFYKGFSSPLVGFAVTSIMVFGVFGNLKDFLAEDSQGTLPLHKLALAAAGGGLTLAVSALPFDNVKIRMQKQRSIPEGEGLHFKSPLDCVKNLWKTGGTFALWKGVRAAVLREVPCFSTYFVMYDIYLNHLPVMLFKQEEATKDFWKKLLAGGFAGATSTSLFYPLDVVKSRILGQPPNVNSYRGPLHCFAKICRTEGLRSLYRGFCPTVLRAFPVNAVVLALYDYLSSIEY